MGVKASEEITVGLMRTDSVTTEELAAALALLSAEEQQRAARFVREEPRREFVLTRALFRSMAGKRLGLEPAAVPVRIAAGGKPQTDGLHFSLSHTRGLSACAISGEMELGIDVEADVRELEVLEIAETAFAAEDVVALQRLTDYQAQRELFLRLWVQREAMAKSLGRGIADPAALRGEWQSEGLHVQMLQLSGGYAGAVAYAAAAECLLVVQWLLPQLFLSEQNERAL